MKEAPHKGLFIVEVGDEQIPLRFDWQAIDAISSAWGDDWQVRINLLGSSQNLEDLADLLEAGTDKPRAFWFQNSPPILDTIDKVQLALQCAFYGPDGVPDPAVDPKSSPKSLRAWFARLFGRGVTGV